MTPSPRKTRSAIPNAVVRWVAKRSSSTNDPGSSRRSIRSRAVSLPRSCCLLSASSPAGCSACAASRLSRSCGVSTSGRSSIVNLDTNPRVERAERAAQRIGYLADRGVGGQSLFQRVHDIVAAAGGVFQACQRRPDGRVITLGANAADTFDLLAFQVRFGTQDGNLLFVRLNE